MFSHRTDWKLTVNRFTAAQRELQAEGRELLDLTISNPTHAGLQYESASILAALTHPGAMAYDPQPKGLLSTREAVAAYYREQRESVDVSPDSLILTASTSEGYSYIFRLLCDSGDEILVPKPSYPLFEFLADLDDVKLAPYPLLYDYGWQIDFPSLSQAVTGRTRAVVIVHPNNPTGNYLNQRDELNAFCREHNLALLVDEVFLDYALDGTPRGTFAGNAGILTFTLSGLSKISALPQLKLAWIATSGPREKANDALARLEVIADTYLSVNTPVQLAAPELLKRCQHMQSLILDRVRTNLAQLDLLLAGQKVCQRLKIEGGWYVVLRVPATQSDEDLAIALLRKTSVLVHPGHFYDFPGDGYLVVSLITPPAEFREGIQRILTQLGTEI